MGLAEKAIRGTLGFGTLNVARYLLTFGSQIVLANLLTPEIFGVVALAITLLTFLTLPMRWGVREALMQETDHESLFSTIFWLRVAFAVPLLAVGAASSPVLVAFHSQEVVLAFLLLALPKGFALMSAPFAAVLQREFELVKVGGLKLVSVVVAVPVSVWFVISGDGLLGLVLFYAIQDIVRTAGVILLSPEYPKFTFDRKAARWFLGFARGMWMSKILNSAESRGDDYLIGSLGGTAALGVYSISWKLAVAFKTIVQPAVNQAILPTFAQIRDSDEQSMRALQFLVRMQLYLSIPGYTAVAIAAPELITFTFGEQWSSAGPILTVLSLTGVLAPLMASTRQFYYSRGASHTILRIQLCYLGTLVVSSILLVPRFGALGGAVAVNLMSLVAVALFFRRLHLDAGFSILETIGMPTVAGLVAAGTAVTLRSLGAINADSVLVVVLAYSMTLFTVYFVVLAVGSRRLLVEDFAIVKKSFDGWGS